MEQKEDAKPTNLQEHLVILVMRLVQRLRFIERLMSPGSTHPFTEYFKGFENVEAVRHIFGERTEQVLRDLRVSFTWMRGYMRVSSADGRLVISSRYLSQGDRVDIYLDLIHELTHVRQFMEGKELFDVHYSYVERPTEIEAYRYAVEEARRLGLSERRICQYLKTEWMTEENLKELARDLNVRC